SRARPGGSGGSPATAPRAAPAAAVKSRTGWGPQSPKPMTPTRTGRAGAGGPAPAGGNPVARVALKARSRISAGGTSGNGKAWEAETACPPHRDRSPAAQEDRDDRHPVDRDAHSD